MKYACLSSIVLFTVAASAAAQSRPSDPAIPPVQAPPALNDPGVVAVPAPGAPAATPAPADSDASPAARAAANSPGLPPEVQAAAEATELPVVTVRQDGSDTVEEYRKRGKLIFVRVLSASGPPKFYVDDPRLIPTSVMQQLSGPSGQVQPVYYKLFDWK